MTDDSKIPGNKLTPNTTVISASSNQHCGAKRRQENKGPSGQHGVWPCFLMGGTGVGKGNRKILWSPSAAIGMVLKGTPFIFQPRFFSHLCISILKRIIGGYIIRAWLEQKYSPPFPFWWLLLTVFQHDPHPQAASFTQQLSQGCYKWFAKTLFAQVRNRASSNPGNSVLVKYYSIVSVLLSGSLILIFLYF